jgi:hypothetical protein
MLHGSPPPAITHASPQAPGPAQQSLPHAKAHWSDLVLIRRKPWSRQTSVALSERPVRTSHPQFASPGVQKRHGGRLAGGHRPFMIASSSEQVQQEQVWFVLFQISPLPLSRLVLPGLGTRFEGPHCSAVTVPAEISHARSSHPIGQLKFHDRLRSIDSDPIHLAVVSPAS